MGMTAGLTLRHWIHVVLGLLLYSMAWGLEIDNGLSGPPEVECGSDRVELQIRTRQPFNGKVFVKGHFNDPGCRVDYTDRSNGGRPTAGIVVPHGACDMSRQRSLTPQGMQFGAVIVVSFHPTFITKVDRAFHVKCMYRETAKTVTAGLEVSMLTTERIDGALPMPTCTYTIRADEIDGPVLKYARVGQQVVHRWECQSVYFGCHLDRFLLGDPTYTEALNMAYRESHVFKFADRIAVQFQCQIRLCVKDNDGCAGITPPMCDGPGFASAFKLNQRSGTTAHHLLPPNGTGARTPPYLPTPSPRPDTTTPFRPTTKGSRQLDATPSIETRRTEMQRISDIFRPRVYRSLPDPIPLIAAGVADGDFASQTLYVLQSTEEPRDRRRGSNWGSHGDIVGLGNLHSVCLGSGSFALLVATICSVLVFGAVSAGAALLFRLRRPLSKSSPVSVTTDRAPLGWASGLGWASSLTRSH